jgi:hypothetical protein
LGDVDEGLLSIADDIDADDRRLPTEVGAEGSKRGAVQETRREHQCNNTALSDQTEREPREEDETICVTVQYQRHHRAQSARLAPENPSIRWVRNYGVEGPRQITVPKLERIGVSDDSCGRRATAETLINELVC